MAIEEIRPFPGNFAPGHFVHKKGRHRFQGYVVSVGYQKNHDPIVTVEHWPEEWVFHFRPDQLLHATEKTMDER